MCHFAPIIEVLKRSSDISHNRPAFMEGPLKRERVLNYRVASPSANFSISSHTLRHKHSDCHVPRHAKQVVFRPTSLPSALEAGSERKRYKLVSTSDNKRKGDY